MSTESEGNKESERNDDNTSSNTSDSGSCDVAAESSQDPSIEEKFVSTMFSCSRETLCLILAVTCSIAFAALHSAPPKISKPPSARPFFNQNSVIIDFYKGQLNAMIERASDADVNFVMYYAPWDAESQIVRYEFERVAHYYHSKMFFSAINCWHPGSECRNQYSKIQSYPVLVLYPSRGTGIQYRGIYSAPYIMRFLDAYMRPIYRISNQDDLMQLLVDNDSVIVGFFDFKGSIVDPGYREFYKTAIRALERDPNRDIIFAAVTSVNTASKEFNIEHAPSASLYLWNESLIYPEDKLWKSENILQWVDQSIHKVSHWIQPPGIKSSTLAPYLHDGPVLLLFTPRNPLHSTNYNHNLLREIALEYYNCGDDVLADQLISRLRTKRRVAAEQHYDKSKKCLQSTSESIVQSPPIPVTIPVERWINDSCCAEVFTNKCLLCGRKGVSRNGMCRIASSKFDEFCTKNEVFEILRDDESDERNFCCDNYSSNESIQEWNEYNSWRTIENDPRSSIAVRLRFNHDVCTNFLAGNNYHHPIFPSESNDGDSMKLETSACDMNRTMAFLSIDSLNYHHFAEGLGIDVLAMRDKTAIIILDSLRESQYLMSQSLNRNSLVQFMNDYKNGSLSRKLRSDAIRQHAGDHSADLTCNNGKEEVCVAELNGATFLNAVLDPTKNVVVMYHSPYCAFCSAISFVYLTVANLLSDVNDIVFVRIDGDNNDLPWEYSMNRYPSVLYFPAKRKEDSTIFSDSLPITVPNLLNFVLANMESDAHILALINICHKGLSDSANNCVARIRRFCLDEIQKNLQTYRKLLRHGNGSRQTDSEIMNKRREILLKLEFIRDIHLNLSFIEDLRNKNNYQQLLRKFDIYYKNLTMIKNRTVSVDKRVMTRTEEKAYVNDEL